jgi:hypothetical protein
MRLLQAARRTISHVPKYVRGCSPIGGILCRRQYKVKKSFFRSPFLLPVLAVLFATTALCASKSEFLRHYKGTPYHDSRYHGGAQAIPGKVYCAYYDLGGEGVAYHDSDAVNHGSGELNPDDGSYLHEFRMKEGVDISYTKFNRNPQVDDSPYDKVVPPAEMLYVGWTVPGEWFNITVQAAKAGEYSVDLLYTSNRGGSILLAVNGTPATGPLTIASTFDAADPVAWRQWHHWSLAPGIAKIKLPKGKCVITVHILTEGQMNLAIFDFKKAR